MSTAAANNAKKKEYKFKTSYLVHGKLLYCMIVLFFFWLNQALLYFG